MLNPSYFIRFLMCFLGVLLFSSCHALVEDEFPKFSQTPVLNGLLQADSIFRVQVSLAANLNDSFPPVVNNALVIIESPAVTPDTLIYTEKGWYVSRRVVKSGTNYFCKVKIPGFPLMTADTTVPEPTEINSIVFTDLASRGEEGEKISAVQFKIPNIPGREKFWQVSLIAEGMIEDYDFENKKWIEYYGINTKYIYMLAGQDTVLLHEANPLTVFSNKKMTQNEYSIKFYFNQNYTNLYGNSQTPYILLRTVEESYYKYIKQFYLYESASGSDLGKSPQRYPLYSNITNGTGLFTGISASKKRLEME